RKSPHSLLLSSCKSAALVAEKLRLKSPFVKRRQIHCDEGLVRTSALPVNLPSQMRLSSARTSRDQNRRITATCDPIKVREVFCEIHYPHLRKAARAASCVPGVKTR